MQPDLEVYDLILTTCLCEYLAENGQEIKAHNHLVAGLNEARALRYEGAPWSEQLVRLWETAVEDFRRRHLEGGCAQAPVQNPVERRSREAGLLAGR